MATFVICSHQLNKWSFITRVRFCGPAMTRYGLVNGAVIDEAAGQRWVRQRGLVQDIGKVGASEARGSLSDRVEVDIIGQRLAFGVNTQDGLTPLEIRGFNRDHRVERPGRSSAGQEYQGGSLPR